MFGSELPIFPVEQQGKDLAATMSQYWSNFARSGEPSDNHLPAWNAADENGDVWMPLGQSVGMEPVARKEQYTIMNRRLDRLLATVTEA